MTILQKIDARGCGCDDHVISKNLITIDEALSRIAQSTGPVAGMEEVTLAVARGRVLAEAVQSRAMVPRFDNSAMDGYAINTEALRGSGPWRLEVADRIVAGQAMSAPVSTNAAAQIFTGAPIPAGADAVVMQESVTRLNGSIILASKVDSGAHIRTVGEDMAAGATILPAGRCLTARDIAACAAAGHANVLVRRDIRVALLVTGDEVFAPGQTRGNAAIWDVNSPMLGAQIMKPGIDFRSFPIGVDQREVLRGQLASIIEGNDVVVTTGGISVGEEDHVKKAFTDLGGTVEFSGVALKPGKPVSFGHIEATHWLGLPGNPLSAFLTWHLFGKALCRRLAGDTGIGTALRHVVLSRALAHKAGRCELRLAHLSGFDGLGREVATFNDATYSGRVARLPEMDGILFIPAEVENLPEGALVEFLPFCEG